MRDALQRVRLERRIAWALFGLMLLAGFVLYVAGGVAR